MHDVCVFCSWCKATRRWNRLRMDSLTLHCHSLVSQNLLEQRKIRYVFVLLTKGYCSVLPSFLPTLRDGKHQTKFQSRIHIFTLPYCVIKHNQTLCPHTGLDFVCHIFSTTTMNSHCGTGSRFKVTLLSRSSWIYSRYKNKIYFHGSHPDWKNGRVFSSQGILIRLGKLGNFDVEKLGIKILALGKIISKKK